MSDKIRVLVVDDHTVVRKGICALLSAEKYGIDVVGEASNGQEAIQKTHTLQPEVILLDLAMPEMGGLEAIPYIMQANPDVRILILTSHAEDAQIVDAVGSGALGYLQKDSSPDDLVNIIRDVYLNRVSLPSELLRQTIMKAQKPVEKRKSDDLTTRELDVLRCVAEGNSNKQIATKLSISITTVRTHISSLLRKLELENRTQLALYARQKNIL